MNSVESHSVPASVLGIIYQVLYPLYLLLRSDNEDTGIFVERFADIHVADEKKTSHIEVKHHGKKVSLSDSSLDLWTTLRVWSDYFRKDHIEINENVVLVLITTAVANKNSVAALLRDGGRDIDAALKRLNDLSKSENNLGKKGKLKKCFDAFNGLTDTQKKIMIERVFIADGCFSVSDMSKKIMGLLNGVPHDYRRSVFERLVGWWQDRIIYHLKERDCPIKKYEVSEKISCINDDYKNDNLPLLFSNENCHIDVEGDGRKFVIHLKKIMDLEQPVDWNILSKAILYFYRATQERSHWLRKRGLLKTINGENEITIYERVLKEKWQEKVEEAQSTKYFDDLNCKEKIKIGRDIFMETRKMEIKIRDRVNASYIMQGSYHILADKDDVAWHPDEIEMIFEKQEN